MRRTIPQSAVYCLFGLAFALATYPAWRPWTFELTLDELLQLVCPGL
jgi:hypothetical protein